MTGKTTPDGRIDGSRLERALRLIVWIVAAGVCMSFMQSNNDIWFILSHGRAVVEGGAFPSVEPLSMHDGLSFVMQQWGYAVMMYLVWSAFGWLGIYLASALTWLACMLVISLIADRLAPRGSAAASMAFLVSAATVACAVNIRPYSVSTLLLLLVVLCAIRWFQGGGAASLVPLPLLSLALVNAHSSIWAMSLVVLLPFLADSLLCAVSGKRLGVSAPSPRWLVVAMLAMFAVAFANPYGPDAVLYILRSYGIGSINENVSEMMAVTTSRPGMLVMDLVPVIVAAAAAGRAHGERGAVRVWEILMVGGLTWLALSHVRGVLFLGAIAMPVAICAFFRTVEAPTGSVPKGLLMAIAAVAASVACAYASNEVTEARSELNHPMLERAADEIDGAGYADGDAVFCGFDGAYLEWRGMRTYIDGRAEVYVKQENGRSDIFDEYVSYLHGTTSPEGLVGRYGFDYIVAEDGDDVYEPMFDAKLPGYELVDEYEDTRSRGVLFGDGARTRVRVWKRI